MARIADPHLAARRRAQILDAALGCFRRRGFHQATMQEICAEAGLSPGALYRYFPSKTDIIAAIAEEEGRMAEPVFTAIGAGADVVDGLTDFARQLLQRFATVDDGPLFAEVMAEAIRDPALARRCIEAQSPFKARLTELVDQARRDGRVGTGVDPEQAARVVVAMIDGFGLHLSIGARDLDAVLADFRAVLAAYLRAEINLSQSHHRTAGQRKRAARRLEETNP